MSFARDSAEEEDLAAPERDLLARALGHASAGRKELAMSELESQILLEDMLLLFIDGISQTAIVAAETLGQVLAPDSTLPSVAASEEPS